MAYIVFMVIVETSIFTKRVIEILSDDEYKELQSFLAANPDVGDIIPGSQGLRKLRWKSQGRGKRGGARVIYYWFKQEDLLLMLFMFRKNEQSDLTPAQVKQLKMLTIL